MKTINHEGTLQPGTRCMLHSMPWPGEAFDPSNSDRFVTFIDGPLDQIGDIAGPWYQVQPNWVYDSERPDLFVKASTLESVYTPLKCEVEAAKRTLDFFLQRARGAS